MLQTRPCDVSPFSDQDKYSLALQDQAGQWIGLDIPFPQIRANTTNAAVPLQRIGMNSFHAGRGIDRHVPDQYGYFDGRNVWTTTPGKAHATQLFKFAKGVRSLDLNMPDANGVTWKKLIGSTRYLDSYFLALYTYTAGGLTVLIRRSVLAGTAGTPGTLTIELRADASGLPGTVLETLTVTSSTITDVTSEYFTATFQEAQTAGNYYHVLFYGASTDTEKACWEVACDPTVAGYSSPSGAGGSWVATTFSPYYRLFNYAAKFRTIPFVWDGALYVVLLFEDNSTSSLLYMNGVRGRAVGTQTSTTLQDTGFGTYASSIPVNRFANAFIRIIRGTGQGQVRQIASNTADTFTVTAAWDVTPVASDSEYVVYATDWFVQISTTGLGIVTGKPAILNGIVYFPQGDGTNIRKMQMDYTDADDHAFGSESATNNNKAYFLSEGYESAPPPAGGPQIWRANQAVTVGTPAAKKISVARAPVNPAGTPVAFSADVTFLTSIPVGDNTNRITNLYFHDNVLHVMKEDSLFIVQNDQAAQVKLGSEFSPSVNNGKAIITAPDRQLYVGFENDMYLVTGGGSYPTGLANNLPSGRSGYVSSLTGKKGWVFAAVDAGDDGISSVMKYSLDTKTYSEQLRSYYTGKRVQSVQWQDCPGTRPRLWVEIDGDMLYQEFPLNGVRPLNDNGMKYQHEGEMILPTVDLLTTDQKYYSVLTITSQGLAQESDTEEGHEIVVEWQADNDVGTSTWYHAGYIRTSPSGSVVIGQGKKRMLRIRLRMLSSEASDPVIIETINLTLFSRNKLANEWTLYFTLDGSDDEQNSYEVLRWLRDAAANPEPLQMYSTFRLFHDRKVTIADEPRYVLQEVDPNENELEATLSLGLTEVV